MSIGIKITAATLAKLIADKARQMKSFAEAVKNLLSCEQTAVKHLDQTGLTVASKTCCVYVLFSTALSHNRFGALRDDVPEKLLEKS